MISNISTTIVTLQSSYMLEKHLFSNIQAYCSSSYVYYTYCTNHQGVGINNGTKSCGTPDPEVIVSDPRPIYKHTKTYQTNNYFYQTVILVGKRS